MATVNEQILSYLNNSKEGDELTILVNVQGTEFFVVYNPTTDRFERVLYSNVFNGDKIKDYLGYTPEDVANKVTDFSTINNELYASLQAIKDYIDFLKSNPNGIAATDADGKILTSQLPPIAITSVILATETTISDFATNSGNYTFEQGDVIVLDNGNGSYFMYNGGTKTDVNSYNQITASEVDWNQIVNIPSEVTNPTLESVLNNGFFGGQDNNIILQGSGYLRIDNNIRIKPKLPISESDGYSSFGVLSDDLFYFLQTKTTGENSYFFGIDVSNLTADRIVETQDFDGKLPLLSSTETNDGDFTINGTFTGKGDGLTDVDADLLGGTPSSSFLNRNSSIESNLDTKYDIDFFGWNDSTVGRPDIYGQGLTFVSSGIEHNNSNNWITQLGFSTSNKAYFRTKVNSSPWGSWKEFFHSGNLTPSDYLNKTTGGTITGTTLYDKTIAEQESASVKTVVNREFVEDYVASNAGLPVGFYEEGTFTPTLTGNTSDNFTYTSFGKYTRIGNQVHFQLSFSSINGNGTGGITISNLPISVSESGYYQQVGKILGSDLTDSEINKLSTTATIDNKLAFQLKDKLTTLFGIVFTNGSFIISGTYITNVYTP